MFPVGGPRILLRGPEDPDPGVELEVAA
jgi:hypothetical protein